MLKTLNLVGILITKGDVTDIFAIYGRSLNVVLTEKFWTVNFRLSMTSPIVLLFLSNLNVIVSEFYDLDVRTVKKIEIKPRRIQDFFFVSGTWNLTKVQRYNLRLFFYY